MTFRKDRLDSPDAASRDESFNLADLVSIIGYKLTAYMGGASSIQSVVDWLRDGLGKQLATQQHVRSVL